MEKVVYENNVDEALYLLNGGTVSLPEFGQVNYYDIIDSVKDININIEKNTWS